MPYVNTYVDSEDILDELSDDELITELEKRGKDYNLNFVDGDKMRMILQSLYEKRRIGKDYQAELDELIYGILGKVI
jgi:predicted glycosyltransferase